MKKLLFLIILFPFSVLGSNQGNLLIIIENIPSQKGSIELALFDSVENYSLFKEKPFRTLSVRVDKNHVQATFTNLPYGDYVISVYQDVNDNNNLDKNIVGIPIEPVGFSQNARGRFGPPSWDEAKFAFSNENQTLYLNPKVIGSEWTVGAAGVYVAQPYVGLSVRFSGFPAVAFQGRRFYIQGPQLGYNLFSVNKFSLGLVGRWRFAGYDSSDSDFLSGMDKREDTLDGGFGFKWQLPANLTTGGEFSMDTLSRHKGHQSKIFVDRRFSFGKVGITPSFEMNYQDRNLASYYFGVEPHEAVPGRPATNISGAFNIKPAIALRTIFGRNKEWMAIGTASLEFLDKQIQQSPIVNRGSIYQSFISILYKI